jgi:hypothetical protein
MYGISGVKGIFGRGEEGLKFAAYHKGPLSQVRGFIYLVYYHTCVEYCIAVKMLV